MARPMLPPEKRQANMLCKVHGCMKKRYARGYCANHFYRLKKYGDVNFTKCHTRDGIGKTPEYRAYMHMKGRCYCKTDNNFENYGGRGIKVCERWLEPNGKGFDNFLKDIGKRPTPSHSIDRIDNDGNYSPENCRWATKTEQAKNRRTRILITAFGKTQNEADWARELGIGRTTIGQRRAYGYTKGEELLAPVGSLK